MSLLHRARIIQIAYVVPDLDRAIESWHRLWGLGPFLVRRHFVLEDVTYRGQPAALEISAAYVQAGDVQLELVTQHDNEPSAFRDMFGPAQSGFHHVALDHEDHDRAVARYRELGFDVVSSFRTSEGRGASYVDTRSAVGHMVEIYRMTDSLRELYARVRHESKAWDGRELRRELVS